MNLMINNYCNLHCSYCFAQEEMNSKKAMNITLDNLCIFLDFLKANNLTDVRLIGGEPTLHPDLEEIIDKIIEYKCFDQILIFTNLTFDEQIAQLLVDKSKDIQIDLLPNINDLDLILPNLREKIIKNLEYLSQNLYSFDRISINIFSPNQELDKWEEIICRYNINSIRWTIVAPNYKITEDFDFYNYFHQFQPLLIKMANWGSKYGIVLNCDCANFPFCCLDDWALSYILKIQKDFFGVNSICSNIVGDIAPDLSTRECFVSTDENQIKLTDFQNFAQFNVYYQEVRAKRFENKIAREECISCPTYIAYGHSCCCYGYHVKEKPNERK